MIRSLCLFYRYGSIVIAEDFGIFKIFKGYAIEGDGFYVLAREQRYHLKAIAGGNVTVLYNKGERLVRRAGELYRLADAVKFAVFKGYVGKGAVTAPFMTEGQAHYGIGIAKGAVTDKNAARGFPDVCAVVTIVQKHAVGVVAAFFGGGGATELFFIREVASEAVGGGSDARTIFCQHIGRAKAEDGAGGLKITISDRYSDIIEACNTVVAGEKAAVLDKDVIAGADVKAIVTG